MSIHSRPNTKSGKRMSYEISATRLGMAIRLVPEEDLRKMHTSHSREEIAKLFGVGPHDVEGLELYYELPARPRGGPNGTKLDLLADRLAERIWPLIEPRIEAAVRDILSRPTY